MGTVRLAARAPGQAPTISAFALGLDAQRYVCPAVVGRRVAQLLDPSGTLMVLSVTGASGLGKSAALRAASRLAAEAGHTVITIDGRRADAADAVGELAALPGGRTLVVIDEADRFGAGLHALGRAIGDLPATTRVVLAAHRVADDWLPEHLDPLAGRLRLTVLGARDGEELLLGYGVTDPAARRAIVDWAAGLPLALVLGAGAWAASGGAGSAFALTRETEHDLVDRIAGPALAHLDPDLLAVAALAGGVDARLLAAVLPDEGPEDGLTRLQACTFVEAAGARLLLHPRLADAIAARLGAGDPARVEALTLRIAAHLRERAVAGEPSALPWLAGLVRDPALRAGLAPPVSAVLYADRVRAGDAAAIRDVLDQRWPGTWSLVEPWLRTDAAHVVRRPDGAPSAVVAALPLSRAGELDRACRTTIAPLVAHARANGLTDRAVVTPFQIALEEGELDPDLLRIRNAVALQRCGVVNPRIDMVVEVTGSSAERAVLAAYGYQEIAGMHAGTDGARAWVADVGPGGIAGLLYDAVALEQGRPALARPGSGDRLLSALEDFHCDHRLAALPVAPTDLAPERAAERVRVWVRDSVDALLAGEPALYAMVVRRYFEPGATHESVMREQFTSRATYFRRLRRARAILGADDDAGIRTIQSS